MGVCLIVSDYNQCWNYLLDIFFKDEFFLFFNDFAKNFPLILSDINFPIAYRAESMCWLSKMELNTLKPFLADGRFECKISDKVFVKGEILKIYFFDDVIYSKAAHRAKIQSLKDAIYFPKKRNLDINSPNDQNYFVWISFAGKSKMRGEIFFPNTHKFTFLKSSLLDKNYKWSTDQNQFFPNITKQEKITFLGRAKKNSTVAYIAVFQLDNKSDK